MGKWARIGAVLVGCATGVTAGRVQQAEVPGSAEPGSA